MAIVSSDFFFFFFYSFIPYFLKWTLPSVKLDMFTDANRGFCLKSKHRMTNSVDPDETVTSHLLCIYTVYGGICFGLKGLSLFFFFFFKNVNSS